MQNTGWRWRARTGEAVCAAIIISVSLTTVSGQPHATERPVSQTVELQPLQHLFLPIDPSWVRREVYLVPSGDESFELVPKPTLGSKLRTFRQVTYFLPGKTATTTEYVKLIRYDGDGHLIQEVDQTAKDRFERDLYPGGSVANYRHWHGGGGVISGVSVDAAGKTLAHVENGRGETIAWMYGPADFIHGWLSGGSYVLTRIYLRRRLASETFWLPSGDSLRCTPANERLTLSTHREFWTKPADGAPYGQAWPAQIQPLKGEVIGLNSQEPHSDAVHDRLLAGDRILRNQSVASVELATAQRGLDYRSRREEFVRQYTAYLQERGCGGLALEIEQSSHPATVSAQDFERELGRTPDIGSRRAKTQEFFRQLNTPAEKQSAIGLIYNRYQSMIPLSLRSELLEPLVADPDLNVRASAVAALGFVASQDPSHSAHLARWFVALLAADPPLRPAALMSLGQSHRCEFAAAASAYLTDPAPAVRAEAAFCIANLTAPKTTYQARIANLLRDADRNVRQRAISALYVMNARRAEPYLEKMLEDPDAYLRIDVVRMLGYSHAIEALPAIRRLRADPDVQVRHVADETIALLGEPAKR